MLTGGNFLFSQEPAVDTLPPKDVTIKDEFKIDSIDYELLLQDMESFLDSIYTPGSYFMGSIAMGRGYYNYTSKTTLFLQTSRQATYTPSFGYFHKSGLGISTMGNLVNAENKVTLYQYSISPAYDYLKNHNLATGISYTRFFTKDSLPFYTTPIQNELFAYFSYRKWWIRPTIAVSYGWGSRTDYEKREELIQDLRLQRRGYVLINSTESVSDFTLIGSVRHDFYWLGNFSYKDHFRFTPQLTFLCGTQKFGFNQSANTYATVARTGTNVLYTSENYNFNDQVDFQPLSLTLFLRGEYAIGKFFIQPQVAFDYYFPAEDKNFNTLFSCNLGFIF